jgi:hypothetical protein
MLRINKISYLQWGVLMTADASAARPASSNNHKNDKSPLEKLLETSIPQGRGYWSTGESVAEESGEKKRVKSYCSDSIEDTLSKIAEEYRAIKQPMIVATTGGAHGELSLYANAAGAKKIKSYPIAFFSSLREENLDYLEFLLGLSLANPTDRFGFLRDLFNISDEKYFESMAPEKVDTLTDALKIQRIQRLIPEKYDSAGHITLLEKASQRIKDKNLSNWLKNKAKTVVKDIFNKGQYEYMKEGIFQDLKNNPSAYWLSSDDLYRTIPKSFSDGKTRIHTFQGNMKEGARLKIREIIKKLGLSEQIQNKGIFYTPNLEREMPELLNFVKNFNSVIYANRLHDPSKPYRRRWNLESGQNIIIESQEQGIPEKYESREANVRELIKEGMFKKLNSGIKLPQINGLKYRHIVGHMNLGSAYSPLDFIRWNIEIVNNLNIVQATWGGGPQGAFMLKENQRRQMLHPRYALFADQLELFKELRDLFKGNIDYITNENDRRMGEIFGYLVKEMMRIEEGKKSKRSYNVHDQIIDYASSEDLKHKIIREFMLPYMLRIGEDPTGVVDENTKSHNLLTLFQIGVKLNNGKSLLKEEENFIRKEGLENKPKFRVFTESQVNNLENKAQIEFIRNSMYSRTTQYKNFSVGLISDIRNRLADSSTNPKEIADIFVDLHQAGFMLTNVAGKYGLFVPHMDQDIRYDDKKFLPHVKDQVLQDPTFNRKNRRKKPNYPGSIILSGGGYGNNLYTIPLFERIMEQQKKIISSGEKRDKISVFFTGDLQFANHSQRPKLFVWAQEYALERGCTKFVYNGDLLQGFNYKTFMLENADNEISPVAAQEVFLTNMFRRYYADTRVNEMIFTHGNHERNSDWDAKGFSLLNTLMASIREHINTYEMHHGKGSRNLKASSPYAAITERAELIKADIAKLDIYDEHFIIQHQFGGKFTGGQRDSPTYQMLMWKERMAPESQKYNWMIGAHRHAWEMRIDENTIFLSLGAPVGGDAYSWKNQYYVEPSGGTIVDIYPNGMVGIENISPVYLAKKYPKDYTLSGGKHLYGSGLTVDEYIMRAPPGRENISMLLHKGGTIEDVYLHMLSNVDATKSKYLKDLMNKNGGILPNL